MCVPFLSSVVDAERADPQCPDATALRTLAVILRNSPETWDLRLLPPHVQGGFHHELRIMVHKTRGYVPGADSASSSHSLVGLLTKVGIAQGAHAGPAAVAARDFLAEMRAVNLPTLQFLQTDRMTIIRLVIMHTNNYRLATKTSTAWVTISHANALVLCPACSQAWVLEPALRTPLPSVIGALQRWMQPAGIHVVGSLLDTESPTASLNLCTVGAALLALVFVSEMGLGNDPRECLNWTQHNQHFLIRLFFRACSVGEMIT